MTSSALWALPMVGLLCSSSPAQPAEPRDFPFSVDFSVNETEGIARVAEPVRVRLPLDSRIRRLKNVSLWNRTARREETVQAENGRILLLCTQGPKSQVQYRLYYGKTQPTRRLDSTLRVSGADLAWKVDTRQFLVDLSKNAGTGRSGQINTILVKDPGVLLTRNRPTSTLHLSPNSAVGQRWNGINRWDPPRKYKTSTGPLSFRLEREGEMPAVPDLHVTTVYEIFEDSPTIAVEETVDATREVAIPLLRFAEWSFAPGPDNFFDHLAWEDRQGQVFLRKKEKEEVLPLDIRWQAFLSDAHKFGFAAVVERLEMGNGAVLHKEAARFAGDPHYFYRTLISSGDEPLVTIPRGAHYAIRYRLYFFQPGIGPQAAEPASTFGRTVRNPLNVRIEGSK